MNKFLKQYPCLRDPQVGELVEIISQQPFWLQQHYYSIGDIGRIIHISFMISPGAPPYFITFDIPENTNKETLGMYWVYKTNFKVIQHNE